jgi:hypothetical protein
LGFARGESVEDPSQMMRQKPMHQFAKAIGGSLGPACCAGPVAEGREQLGCRGVAPHAPGALSVGPEFYRLWPVVINVDFGKRSQGRKAYRSAAR